MGKDGKGKDFGLKFFYLFVVNHQPAGFHYHHLCRSAADSICSLVMMRGFSSAEEMTRA